MTTDGRGTGVDRMRLCVQSDGHRRGGARALLAYLSTTCTAFTPGCSSLWAGHKAGVSGQHRPPWSPPHHHQVSNRQRTERSWPMPGRICVHRRGEGGGGQRTWPYPSLTSVLPNGVGTVTTVNTAGLCCPGHTLRKFIHTHLSQGTLVTSR